MKKLIALVLSLAALEIFAVVPIKWTVETSRAETQEIEIYHGEELAIEVTFKTYGETLQLSTNADAQIFWQTNGMDTAYWRTNAVEVLASNGIMRTNWTKEMDVGAKTVRGFIGIAGDIYRASFVLRFKDAPGYSPEFLEWPFRLLDFSVVEVKNAPYYTKAETEGRITDRVAWWAMSEQDQPIVDLVTNGVSLVTNMVADLTTIAAKAEEGTKRVTPAQLQTAVSNAINNHNTSTSPHEGRFDAAGAATNAVSEHNASSSAHSSLFAEKLGKHGDTATRESGVTIGVAYTLAGGANGDAGYDGGAGATLTLNGGGAGIDDADGGIGAILYVNGGGSGHNGGDGAKLTLGGGGNGENNGGCGAKLTLGGGGDGADGQSDGAELMIGGHGGSDVTVANGSLAITHTGTANETLTQRIVRDAGSMTNNLASTEWVTNQGYVTSSALSGYATESYVDGRISPTDTGFSNAVLGVGLNIDTNSVAVLNEIAATYGNFPIEGTATTVGGLLLALAAAISWLRQNKRDKSDNVCSSGSGEFGSWSRDNLPTEGYLGWRDQPDYDESLGKWKWWGVRQSGGAWHEEVGVNGVYAGKYGRYIKFSSFYTERTGPEAAEGDTFVTKSYADQKIEEILDVGGVSAVVRGGFAYLGAFFSTANTLLKAAIEEITDLKLNSDQIADEWESSTTYAADANVTYKGKFYKSLQASNLNHSPDETSSAWWEVCDVFSESNTSLMSTINSVVGTPNATLEAALGSDS